MPDDKTQKIEITLAHHEQQIQDLSEMISLQWKEIERLKLLLSKTNDKISELETASESEQGKSVSEIAASEKPPHY